jgi:hypothetical protein
MRRRGSSNTWIMSGQLERGDTTTAMPLLVGQTPLSGPIDRVGITVSTDTVTAGAISVWYR